jgi:small-conductance mechanosensitive channel
MSPICRTKIRSCLLLSTPLLALLLFLPAVHASPDNPQDIISFLNQTIVWYRQLSTQQQLINEPSDVLFLNDNRQIADQVSRLSFEFARARAQTMGNQNSNSQGQPEQAASELSRNQNLADLAAKSDKRIKETQQEIESMKSQLAGTTGQKRRLLESTLAETESELGLLQARKNSVKDMLDFVSGTAPGSSHQGGLPAQIEELARTLPASATEAVKQAAPEPSSLAGANSASVAAATSGRKDEPSGIFALLEELLALRRKLNLLDNSLQLTDSLGESSKALREPLLASVRELVRRGDELTNQPDSQDNDVLAQQRKELDNLTAQFKQLSAIMLPLGKQAVLLDLYRRSSSTWRNAVSGQHAAVLKSFLVRLAILGVVLMVVLGIADLWRRVTFRYVQDVRRRHQFLVLRRIIVGFIIALIIIVASVNGLGSVTTFAGLLTAGVAVAMQNVILAIVGYFFLIGKHGIRVGDRVQVSGVMGNIVDIGLVRMHLMELSPGPTAQPTGRIVAFSNSVVFQPSAGFYKQISGTNFVWHEVTLNLPAESDYRPVEEKMLQAVTKIFADYQERMESQLRHLERSLKTVTIDSLHPESRVRLTRNGLRVTIRYPVEMQHAAEIDDRVTREVLAATEREPKVG